MRVCDTPEYKAHMIQVHLAALRELGAMPEPLTDSEFKKIEAIRIRFEARVRKAREQLQHCEREGLMGYAGDWREWLKEDEEVLSAVTKLLAHYALHRPATTTEGEEKQG